MVVELPWTAGCLLVVGELVGDGDRYFLISTGFLLISAVGLGVGFSVISGAGVISGEGELSLAGEGDGATMISLVVQAEKTNVLRINSRYILMA